MNILYFVSRCEGKKKANLFWSNIEEPLLTTPPFSRILHRFYSNMFHKMFSIFWYIIITTLSFESIERGFCKNICQVWLDRQNHSQSRYWTSFIAFLTLCPLFVSKQRMSFCLARQLPKRKPCLLLRKMRSSRKKYWQGVKYKRGRGGGEWTIFFRCFVWCTNEILYYI